MIRRMPFDPVVTGFTHISCAGASDAEAVALFRGERPPETPRPACDVINSSIRDQVFYCDAFRSPADAPRTLAMVRALLPRALDAAGLTPSMVRGPATGCVVGTTIAHQFTDTAYYAILRDDPDTEETAPVERFLNSNPAEAVAREYSLEGPVHTVSNACSSGADAVSLAALCLLSGQCERMVVIGADELHRTPVAGFHVLGVTSPFPCRPFDSARAGLNLGEAAGIVILENPECARKRGRKPEFALRGFGMSCDASHITAPDATGGGMKRAFRDAMLRAGLTLGDIAFINAHGTGTILNDQCETAAFAGLAEEAGLPVPPPFLSTKRFTGHTLGAAGTLEYIFTMLMLRDGLVPASPGCKTPDPVLACAPLTSPLELPCGTRFAASTSLAFGGTDAVLIAERLG
jgi:3-oxoacyl-(acyl-carrier-protein) synthase